MELPETNRDTLDETWLITGAAGRIGTGLADHLRNRVSRLILTDSRPVPGCLEGATAITLDLRDPNGLERVLRGVTGVIHLGGIADEAPFTQLLETNVLGTYNLLEAMRVSGVRRLVYASSNRVTGMHPATTILDDQTHPLPDGLYGVSKVAAEALTSLYATKFGTQVVNVRIGSFEDTPTSPREAATWLSPADAWKAFDAAMTSSAPLSTFYAVSNNRHRFWSLEPGNRVGFHPVDDASDHLGPEVAPPLREPQGGDFASADYTLRRM